MALERVVLPQRWLQSEWVERFCVSQDSDGNNSFSTAAVDDAGLFLWIRHVHHPQVTGKQYRKALRDLCRDKRAGYKQSPLPDDLRALLNIRIKEIGKRQWAAQVCTLDQPLNAQLSLDSPYGPDQSPSAPTLPAAGVHAAQIIFSAETVAQFSCATDTNECKATPSSQLAPDLNVTNLVTRNHSDVRVGGYTQFAVEHAAAREFGSDVDSENEIVLANPQLRQQHQQQHQQYQQYHQQLQQHHQQQQQPHQQQLHQHHQQQQYQYQHHHQQQQQQQHQQQPQQQHQQQYQQQPQQYQQKQHHHQHQQQLQHHQQQYEQQRQQYQHLPGQQKSVLGKEISHSDRSFTNTNAPSQFDQTSFFKTDHEDIINVRHSFPEPMPKRLALGTVFGKSMPNTEGLNMPQDYVRADVGNISGDGGRNDVAESHTSLDIEDSGSHFQINVCFDTSESGASVDTVVEGERYQEQSYTQHVFNDSQGEGQKHTNTQFVEPDFNVMRDNSDNSNDHNYDDEIDDNEINSLDYQDILFQDDGELEMVPDVQDDFVKEFEDAMTKLQDFGLFSQAQYPNLEKHYTSCFSNPEEVCFGVYYTDRHWVRRPHSYHNQKFYEVVGVDTNKETHILHEISTIKRCKELVAVAPPGEVISVPDVWINCRDKEGNAVKVKCDVWVPAIKLNDNQGVIIFAVRNSTVLLKQPGMFLW